MAENDPPRYFIFEVDVEYHSDLHECDDDYPMAAELMTIKQEKTEEKQLEHKAKYFATTCPYSIKLNIFKTNDM